MAIIKGGLSPDQMSNLSSLAGLATSVTDSIPIGKGLNQDFVSSKYGKQARVNSNINDISSKVGNIGFNPQLMSATGGISAIVGAGFKASSMINKANTDQFGRTKSGAADFLSNTLTLGTKNLVRGIKNLGNKDLSTKDKILSFTPLGHTVQNKIANKQKNLFDRSNALQQTQELKTYSGNVYGFKQGGTMPKSGCGCTMDSDGIDTDVFKSFDTDTISLLQEFIGNDIDGVYKDSDKDKMKSNAKQEGIRLIDYLNKQPIIKMAIIKNKKGGVMLSNESIERIYKAGGVLKWQKLGTNPIHIKPENKGKFTEYCGGKVTNECIDKAKSSGNSKLIKRAVFADNSRKWN